VNAAGTLLGTSLPVSNSNGHPAIAWNPTRSEFGAAWLDNGLVFARIAGSSVTVVTPPASNLSGGLALGVDSTGEYLATYTSGNVLASRLDGLGAPAGLSFAIGAGYSGEVASTGSGFGVVWQTSGSGGVSFVRTASGQLVGSASPLSTTGSFPVIAWGANRWTIAWAENFPSSGGREVQVQQMSPPGSLLSQRITVAPQGGSPAAPTVAWNYGGVGVAWSDARDGNFEIYFARLECVE
jgi:hypothetical protein